MKNLKDKLQELIMTRGELKLEVSDDVILEQAVKLFISENIANQRQGKETQTGNAMPTPPTPALKPIKLSDKQTKILKKMKYTDEQISNMTIEDIDKHITDYIKFCEKVKKKK